jgi:hypothetical protein
MAEILELKSIPKIARENNIVVWFERPSEPQLKRMNHRVVWVDTYNRTKKQPIKLAFTLPINGDFTDEIKKAVDHMANEACRIVEKKREVEGITKKYKVKREVITYSILWQVCIDAFNEYKDHIEGRYFKLITAMVFSAFCLEAYLNHVGRMYFPYWMEEEKEKSPEEKLEMISDKLGMTLDFSKRPFQTFGKIFWFRNNVAHGKTEYLSMEGVGKFLSYEDPPLPNTEWETLVSEKHAAIFMNDTDEIIKVIHKNAGFKKIHHFDLGLSSWEASTAKRDEDNPNFR